ncbi:MAG: hypothetical protein RAO92_05300 [Candidatus Euphemobacter frigidus]|nr:hypothetical protein [Candidatus Euphemobacter frigidus]
MRTINLLSATTLMKMEDSLLLPFDVMAMHHILDNLISQDAILDQMDSDELSYACTTGNIRPLWDIAPEFPLLQRGFTSGWINRFILEPFDPLCVMLAMRAKAMLDLVDEEGHSYNLIRKLGFGFIDFGEIPGEEPGDPGDYYPPEIDNPIDFPEIPTPPGPEPGEPGYVPPGPGEPGYVPPGPGEPGYVPGVGEPGYTEPGDVPAGTGGGGPGGGAPWGFDRGPGDLGGAVGGGRTSPPVGGDPCADLDDPLETVTFSYTTQQMACEEEQGFALVGNAPRWSYANYEWKISAGDGMLAIIGEGLGDPIYGPENDEYDPDAVLYAFAVKYTAPAVNPACTNNPTVELWCGEALMASLTIAVNEVVDYAAMRYVEAISCVWDGYGFRHTIRITMQNLNCAGEWKTDCNTLAYVYGGAPGDQCEAIMADSENLATSCGISIPYSDLAVGEYTDLRTEAMIAEGCCPEELL